MATAPSQHTLLPWSDARFQQWARCPRMSTKPLQQARIVATKVPLSTRCACPRV